jgi:hypothetical protein
MWRLLRVLPQFLIAPITIVLVGLGLMIGSLIAICITSGILVIMLIRQLIGGREFPLIPMCIALGVEGLILVIGVAMWMYANAHAWQPPY